MIQMNRATSSERAVKTILIMGSYDGFVKRLFVLLLATLISLVTLHAEAESDEEKDAISSYIERLRQERAINRQVQDLKQKVLDLNRDLFVLEENLLFPANTQVAVFVSMNLGEFFQLDSVELKIDDKVVAHYLYTEKQVQALYRGGVQRLYVGNYRNGDHELSAFFVGTGPQGREYRRATSTRFVKSSKAKMLELKIVDSVAAMQPEFSVTEWE